MYDGQKWAVANVCVRARWMPCTHGALLSDASVRPKYGEPHQRVLLRATESVVGCEWLTRESRSL
jgi:hypothetical protein